MASGGIVDTVKRVVAQMRKAGELKGEVRYTPTPGHLSGRFMVMDLQSEAWN